MFCNKCGNPVPDGASFCAVCGCALEAPAPVTSAPAQEAPVQNWQPSPAQEAPVQNWQPSPAQEAPVQNWQPVQDWQPSPAQGTYSQNYQYQQPQNYQYQQPQNYQYAPVQQPVQPDFNLNTQGTARKKSKAPLFIILGVVAAALIALIAFNFGTILSWFGVKPEPRTQLKNLIQDGVNSAFDRYDKALKFAGFDSFQDTDGTAGSVKLSVDDSIIDLLASSVGLNAESIKSMLEGISLDYHSTGDGTKIMNRASLTADGEELFDLTQIMDMATGELWLSMPDLNPQALYVYDPSTSEEMAVAMELLAAVPADKLKTIVLRYTDMAVDGLTEVICETEEVTACGVTEEQTVLRCCLTEADARQLVLNIMQKLKTDKDVKALLQDMGEAADYAGLYDSFVEALDEAIEELTDVQPENAELCFDVYLSGNEFAGMYAELPGSGDELYCAITRDGENVGLQLNLASEIELSGSGIDQGKDGISGEFVLTADGEQIITVVLENVVDGDTASGTIKLKPGTSLLEEIDDSLGMDGETLAALNPAISLTLNGVSSSGGSLEISFEMSGTKVLSMIAEYAEAQAEAIAIPGDCVDAMDEEALEQWASESGLDDILQLLGLSVGSSDYEVIYD